MLNINSLLIEASKSGDRIKLECVRAIKDAELRWKTSKEHAGKDITEEIEMNLIRKLVAQYEDTAEQCNDGKHQELVDNAKLSATYLKQFLPAPVTEEKIQEAFDVLACNIEPIKKNMGQFIKEIKATYPGADGKLISMVVQKHLS